MVDLLSVRCPHCGATSDKVPAAMAGRTVRCPRCAARFDLPARQPSPAPTVPEAEAPAPTIPEEGAAAPTVAEKGAAAATVPEDAVSSAGSPAGWRKGDVVLGLYEVGGILGEGGMGRVYRVRHRAWGLDLAVKAPLPSVLEAAGGADLFEQEAETWVSLGLHPHVVTCYYVRRIDGLPVVFAEYVDGGSLHDAIRARRLDSPETILDVGIQFAWGLHHAHEQGLVHRDVKPANVMLSADGVAKVTDFGLARARSAPIEAKAAMAGHTMTVEGGAGGTPAYLSPEQARGESLNRRSDLWSFGLALLEAFVGGRTWAYGLAAPEVLAACRRDGISARGRPPLPETVAELLARCFRERPEDRPHDLAEVAAALRDAWETLAGRPYPRREPKGGPGSADALNNRAVSLVDLGRTGEAVALWRRALEAEPQHIEATYNGGLTAWVEARSNDHELLRRMDEACGSHAASARAHQLRGRLLLAAGQRTEALAAFQRAADLGGGDDLDPDLARARAEASPLRTLRGLSAPAAAFATTGDGRIVAAGGGGEVRLWDTAKAELVRTLSVPDGPVRALAFLPDGRFLLVAAERAALALWDLDSGQRTRSWARHAGFATSLAVLPGGRFAVSGGSDRVVRLWEPSSGRIVREMAGHEDAVTAVGAGASRLVSASRDGTVRIWALEDGRCLATLRGHSGRVLAVTLDEPRSRVCSGGEDGTVRDWGLHSHELVRTCASHGQAVTAVALSPDGRRVLSASADCTVRGFDAETGRLVSFVRVDGAAHALAVAADGVAWAAHATKVSGLPAADLQPPPAALCRPASGAEEERHATRFAARIDDARRSLLAGDLVTAVTLVREARSVPGHERSATALEVWDDLGARLARRALMSAWEEARLEGHADQVLAVAVDGTGGRALSAGLDATLRVWDLAARRLETTFSGHGGAATSVAFAGPGRAVSGGRDRTVRLWDLRTGRSVAVLEGHDETVAAVDATADGSRAVSGSWDGTIRLWDLRRPAVRRVFEGHGAHVAGVRLSPDGQVIASAGWDGTARLWDVESGSALGTLAGHEGTVTAVALHADGRQVATGGEDRTVRLWDARTRRAGHVLRGHEGEITGLVFTPDGRFLASSSRDRTVRVWDLRQGAAVRTLSHPALVLGLALTPGGAVLLTAAADAGVRVFHFDWEPDTAAPTAAPVRHGGAAEPTARVAAASTTRVAPATVRVTSPEPTHPPRHETLREDLRRAAPVSLPSLPKAARRLPWRWIALGLAAMVLVTAAWIAWRRPPSGPRLSPYMAKVVPAELDLIDLAPFRRDCSPADYELHLERMRAGNPEARDVACIAAAGMAGAVADVLDSAPLASPDELAGLRLRRSAASALAGLPSEAISVLCARLEDERPEARETVAMALGVMSDGAAVECVRGAAVSGTPAAQWAAGAALRQQLARGRIGAVEGWALIEDLLGRPESGARKAGLRVAPIFAAATAEPAVRRLLEDSDPDVAGAAREALASIDAVRRADLLHGGGS
jgi:WD40 repeat protein/serine/threonine protein kinase